MESFDHWPSSRLHLSLVIMDSQDNTPTCSECGLMYQNTYHLLQHIKDSHQEKFLEEERPFGSHKQEEVCTNQEKMAFNYYQNLAIDKIRETETWEKKFKQFLKDGFNEDTAMTAAADSLKNQSTQLVLESYRAYFKEHLLNKDNIHNEIIGDLMEYWKDEYNRIRLTMLAVLTVKRHKHVFPISQTKKCYKIACPECGVFVSNLQFLTQHVKEMH